MKTNKIIVIALLFALIAPLSTYADLSTGLVGWWTFDGKNMAQNVADSSGNGINGHLVGFTSTSSAVVPGKIGQALKFSGTSNVDIPDSSDASFTGPITVSAWVYITQGGNYNAVLIKAAGSLTNNPIEFRTTSDAIPKLEAVRANAGGSNGYIPTSQSVSLNTWHMVSVTYSDNLVQTLPTFYLDGVLLTSLFHDFGTGSGAVTGSGADIIIGRRPDGVVQMNGSLDDVRIYNRALSAQEIAELYMLGLSLHAK